MNVIPMTANQPIVTVPANADAVKPTILVTGAGGFVGGTIIEALYFANQYQVRAGIARWSSAPRIARLPITLVQCDVLQPQELIAACTGADAIIHCAVGDDDVIVRGTANVLDAAARAGVKRVIHISSVAVYGAASGMVNEDTPPPPGSLTAYGAAKVAAEQLCARQCTLEVVRLRPTIIYGPFSTLWTMLYAMRLRTGRWKQLGALGEGICNLVHVHDVARYAIAAVSQDGVAGEAFNINGPEIITWNAYLERFNHCLGLPSLVAQTGGRVQIRSRLINPVRSVGKYALKHHASTLRWLSLKSTLLQQLMQQTELTLRCIPNSEELALFSLAATYDTTKANSRFGFRASVDVDNGLVMSVAWLKHIGELAL